MGKMGKRGGGVVLLLFILQLQVMKKWCVVGDDEKLAYDFYEESCPGVERFVKEMLVPIFLSDPSAPAALLRLFFHDCQVQGCDGSILLDYGGVNLSSEMGTGKNYGIRRRDVIETIKLGVESFCPGKVSCSDLLVLAAREGVAMSGGPNIRVPLGRRDAITANYKLADATLPPSTTGVDGMLQIFANKGMTLRESVAILGAHTIGITHCLNVARQETQPPEFGERLSSFQLFVQFKCRQSSPLAKAAIFLVNDLTNFIFDNQYYRDTLHGRGLLRIDSDMARDPRTAPIVTQFAMDQNYFFEAFTSAFVKLSYSGVLTGKQGRVLKKCNKVD